MKDFFDDDILIYLIILFPYLIIFVAGFIICEFF